MKFFWLFVTALFFAPGGAAQESQLPPQMPEAVAVSFNQTGGMSRSYRRFGIENGNFEFEELKGNQEPPKKWTASVSRAELAKIYRVFVENKFDTIKNDERKGIVYDAGSESISLSAGAGKYFGVTYGKNSPLSGKNLERYQRVKKALDDFVARRQHKKTENSSNDNQELSEAEKRIEGDWRAEGNNGRYGWFLEWTFADGNFEQKGYPPIYQAGKYRVIGVRGDKVTLELYDQKGNFGEGKRTVEIISGSEGKV